MKLTNSFVGLLAVSQHVAAVVDKWTPADFDWDHQLTYARYDVATQNMTTNRPFTKEMVLFAADNHNMTESDLVFHEAFAIAFSLAATLRVVGWLSTAAGLVSTGLGCYELIDTAVGGEQTTDKSKASCVLGLASSALGFGVGRAASYLAGKAAAAARLASIPPSLPPPDLGFDFSQAFELAQFAKRDLDAMASGLEGRGLSAMEKFEQHYTNHFTAAMVRDAGMGEPEFIGYASEKHQLSKRDGVHVLAPRFKFDHPRHGSMVLSTRFTNTTSHIVVEPFVLGNAKIHKRYQEQYEKEILEDNKLLEARFDHEAFDADPSAGDITLDDTNVFNMAEDSLHCALNGQTNDGWPLDQVLDVQFYDDTNHATFGYATLGVFDDHNHDGDLGGQQPQPPVVGNC